MKKTVIGAVTAAALMASAAGLLLGLNSGGRTFDDVTELRVAAENADLDCPAWERTSDATANCSRDTVLIVKDEAQLKQSVEDMQKKPAGEDVQDLARDLGVEPYQYKYKFLAGKNWIINSPDAPDLADELGGKVYANY